MPACNTSPNNFAAALATIYPPRVRRRYLPLPRHPAFCFIHSSACLYLFASSILLTPMIPSSAPLDDLNILPNLFIILDGNFLLIEDRRMHKDMRVIKTFKPKDNGA